MGQRLNEQRGVFNQAITLGFVGLPVMGVKRFEFPCREGIVLKLPQQGVGMFRVGARQRRKNPLGSPHGNLALAHLCQQRFG